MEVVVSKMSMTGLSFGLIDLILNSVSEATPYWDFWCQTASNALCHFSDWVGAQFTLIFYLCAYKLFLILISNFRGPSTLATFVAVYALFGPTFPGSYDKDRGVYTLFYPVYTRRYLSKILFIFLWKFVFFHAEISLVSVFCRVYLSLFQFPPSIQIAAMMEKVSYQ